MSSYSKRGVSAQKEDVHSATKNLDKGLYSNSFCKIFPDHIGGDANWVNLMHADGAGSKSILAYLYWKETGDISVWKGIAQDAIVMNLDDLLCVGIYDKILFSSTIDRNKNLISAEVLEVIINSTQEFFNEMKNYGINITFMGGETADVGDVVRTIAVNGTMTARWPKSKLITNEKIKANNVIIGLAAFGKSTYESEYNSGIASNGLTSARHDMLDKYYSKTYPESYDERIDESLVYSGSYRLTDKINIENKIFEVGQLLLSPTRTFAPIIKAIMESHIDKIQGLIHCSGGGQTKCLKYIPENVRIVKDNLFEPPFVFDLIQQVSKSNDYEMYQVFNMGTRLEIYVDEKDADLIIAIAESFGVAAQIIGRVEQSVKKELIIKTKNSTIIY